MCVYLLVFVYVHAYVRACSCRVHLHSLHPAATSRDMRTVLLKLQQQQQHSWIFACRLVGEEDPWDVRREFLEEVMLATYAQRTSQTEAVNAMPLYPTEAILWDDNQVPDVHYTGASCHANMCLMHVDRLRPLTSLAAPSPGRLPAFCERC